MTSTQKNYANTMRSVQNQPEDGESATDAVSGEGDRGNDTRVGTATC
ncbi:hypothetical protein AB0L65_42315 [Nonomuraea sp. NPDC052116]